MPGRDMACLRTSYELISTEIRKEVFAVFCPLL